MSASDKIVRTDIFKAGSVWIATDINLLGEECDSADFPSQREAIQAALDTRRFAVIDVYTATNKLKRSIDPQSAREGYAK